ncbi:hypothetical protein ACH5AO_27210 [Streptomyces sp. NPDC018964]|uniref:hypothetical protein n=1 Tax=unclassified Streptomyces TaxID=2593676 RepID=UPI00378F35A8
MRLTVRTCVQVLLGGSALLTIVTVTGVLGPMLGLGLRTPPVAARWTVFTAVVVQGWSSRGCRSSCPARRSPRPSARSCPNGSSPVRCRAAHAGGYSLKGRTVRLTGFVTTGDGGTRYVTRLRVACCAADATAVRAEAARGRRRPARG